MKKTELEKDFLFWVNKEKSVYATRNGVACSLTVEELLKRERDSGDLADILENIDD